MPTNSWFNYESDKPRWWEKAAIGSATLAGKAAGLIGLRKPIGYLAMQTPALKTPVGYENPFSGELRRRNSSLMAAGEPGPLAARTVLARSMFDLPIPPSLMRQSGLKRTAPKNFAFDTTTHTGAMLALNATSVLTSYRHDKYPGLGGMYYDKWDVGLNKRPNKNTVPSLMNRVPRAFLGGLTRPATVSGAYRDSHIRWPFEY